MSKKRSIDDDDENASSSEASPFVCMPMYGEHKRAVSSVQLAPSRLTKHGAALCASASADGSVKIWDLSDPEFPESRGVEYALQSSATLVGHSRGINDVCWSNGNLFRALTLLSLTHCEQTGQTFSQVPARLPCRLPCRFPCCSTCCSTTVL